MNNFENLKCITTTEAPPVWVLQNSCETLTLAFFEALYEPPGKMGGTKIPFPGEPADVRNPIVPSELCCGETWLKWNAGEKVEDDWVDNWVNLNNQGEYKLFLDKFKDVASTSDIEQVIARNFTCYQRNCDKPKPVDDCCCDNNGLSVYGIGLLACLVFERIEHNKKRRGVDNNHGEAVALVGAALMLLILAEETDGSILLIGLLVFIGMTLISRTSKVDYNLLTSNPQVNPRTLTL